MTVDLRLTRRLVLALSGCLLALPAWSQAALSIKPLAEKRVDRLPEGDLFWRIENFPSEAEAAAAATPWSLNVKAAGKVWLFTLGAPGRASERAAPGRRGRADTPRQRDRVPGREHQRPGRSRHPRPGVPGALLPHEGDEGEPGLAPGRRAGSPAAPASRARPAEARGRPAPGGRRHGRRLARNRQQTLATIVLMGINRIVVTDGRIVPKIKFDRVRR